MEQRSAALQGLLKTYEASQVNAAKLVQDNFRAELRSKEKDLGYSSVIYRSIAERIDDFQANLDNEHEIGATLASFGSTVTIRVTSINFIDPYLIIFTGETADGDPAELVQHVTQVNFLLVALPKPAEQPEPRRIGFQH